MSVENIIESVKEEYNSVYEVNLRLQIIKLAVNLERKTLKNNMSFIQNKYRAILDETIDIDLDFKNISEDKELIQKRKDRRQILTKETDFFNYFLNELDHNLYCGFPEDGKLAGFIASYDHDTFHEVKYLGNTPSKEYNITAKHLNRAATHFKNLLNDKFELSEFDLSSLCKEVSDVLISSKDPKKCEFAGDEVIISANIDSVYEALFNIGKNGIYHGNEQIKFLVENHSNYALVKIRDAGKGIERKNRGKVKKGIRLNHPNSRSHGLKIATYAIETINGGLITFRKSQDPEYTGNEARIYIPTTQSFSYLKKYFNIRDRLLT
ncbi:MAG: hypothetical protein WC758_01615 [Candidatus Woesearchaeota archaeon]|jgi:hypothetical protein